jgi:hypothetical protein
MPGVHIDWRAALAYVTREPAWKQRVAVGGVLMLVVPPLGWILALGYRSLVGNRLVDGYSPVLPPWRGNLAVVFRRGASSSGVILGYLTPFLLVYWLLGRRGARALLDHGRELGTFAGAVVLFPPLAIPTLPVIYSLRYEWLHFSATEIFLLMIVFLGAIVLLPAAFLQVARHRRFRAAFNVTAASSRRVSAAALLRGVGRFARCQRDSRGDRAADTVVALLVVPGDQSRFSPGVGSSRSVCRR